MKERLVLSKSGLGGIERGSRGGEMGGGGSGEAFVLARCRSEQSREKSLAHRVRSA